MGFFDKLFGGKTEQEETVKFFGQSKTVLTPIRGKVLAQADIPDETFAQGILGPGCGIEPTGKTVYAPFDGTAPTMAGACIGSGPKFAGCTRCVGDAAPYNTPSILQQYPPKMQSLFSETAFFIGRIGENARFRCAFSAPAAGAARAGKRRRLRAESA